MIYAAMLKLQHGVRLTDEDTSLLEHSQLVVSKYLCAGDQLYISGVPQPVATKSEVRHFIMAHGKKWMREYEKSQAAKASD